MNGVSNPIQFTNKKNSLNEFTKEEIELMADLTEAGLSLRNTTAVLNNIRRQKNMKELSKSSLHRMTCKLKPIRRSILKIPKGSFDKYAKWCQARKKWSLQLAIRFGTIKWSEISTEPPPQYYDISHIGQIHVSVKLEQFRDVILKYHILGMSMA